MNSEITLNTTDRERSRLLSEKQMIITVNTRKMIKEPVTAKALKDYAKEKKLIGKKMVIGDYRQKIKFSSSTIRSSITQANKKNSGLDSLAILLPVIEAVCKNAIKIGAETSRYMGKKGDSVRQMHLFLGAFSDGDAVYPVKICVSEKKKPSVLFIIGEEKKFPKTIEAPTNTGAIHQHLDKGSLSDGGTSLVISVASFVSKFNRNDSPIIKSLPNGILNDEQITIKNKSLHDDLVKLAKLQLKLSGVEYSRIDLRNYSSQEIMTVIENSKDITKLSSMQLTLESKTISDNKADIKQQAKDIKESDKTRTVSEQIEL